MLETILARLFRLPPSPPRPLSLACLVLLWGFSITTGAEPNATHTVALNGHNFTLPTGFEIELVAGPPLVERPITIDFDGQGRLYVAESSGSSEKVEVQLEKKPHRILRLTDTNGDGRYDERTVFADRMMFPEGTMWFAGSLYVAAPPSIWKLTDTNDDGVADQREEWFQGKTLTGCANDLHGPYLGPDGWIYWCKGAFAKQTYQRPDGSEWSTRASHVFRCRPDGSGIEAVMTGGMDNPVDLAFLPGGERFVSNTFLVHPGGGLRDGLIHAVCGGIYGKDHEPIHEHLWTSPKLMPVLSHLGPAAPCGLHRYESTALGEEYQNNLFTTCFNMRKVVRTVLTTNGASYSSRDEDWLVSDHVDFHPTDVLEDADGSLLVVDTGGWYKLCCPTSQIQKEDVLGGIYRIRRKDAKRVDDPRGLKIDWQRASPEALVKLLADEQPAVQRRAIETLATKGKEVLSSLEQGWSAESAHARRNVVWTACRIDDPRARQIAARGLEDGDPDVRQAAGHAASLWRDPSGVSLLVRSQAANRRIAAEVAGRSLDADSFPLLLSTFANPHMEHRDDRFLDHSLLYAMVEIAAKHPKFIESLPKKLNTDNPRQVRAVLTVLHLVDSPLLKAEQVIPALDSADPDLREVAFWIVAKHPEWGSELAEIYRSRLRSDAADERLADQLAALARSPQIQELIATTLSQGNASSRSIALATMTKSQLAQIPAAWLEALAAHLQKAEENQLDAGLKTARSFVREKQVSQTLNERLLRIGRDAKCPSPLRLLALDSVAGGVQEIEYATFRFLIESLLDSETSSVAITAASVLERAKLTTSQQVDLARVIETAGPTVADSILKTLSRSKDDQVGRALVVALRASSSKESLPVGMLRERLKGFGPAVQADAEELFASLDAVAASQRERLEKTLATLPVGDIRRGQQVFHSAKALCSSCHAIGFAGGNVGPDLTKIGLVRTDRDLLESVLFPSNSFVQGYEPSVVVTKEGRTYSGLLRKTSPDQWQMHTAPNQMVRLSPDDVEEVSLGKVSVMPAGLDQQLTPQQLADLVAYLKACR